MGGPDSTGCSVPTFRGVDGGARLRFGQRWWIGAVGTLGWSPEVLEGVSRRFWSVAAQGLVSLAPRASLEPLAGVELGVAGIRDSLEGGNEVTQAGYLAAALAGLRVGVAGPLSVSVQTRAVVLAFGSDPPPLGDGLRATEYGLGPWFSVAAGVILRLD